MFGKCVYKMLDTNSKDYGMLIVRWALAIFVFVHGTQKMFGWFGGNGYDATMGWFTQSLGVPVFLAFLVILGEVVAPIALVFGHKVRFAAFWILCILIGAVALVHFKNGWFDFELHFLAIAMSLALIVKGGGAWSADNVWKKWFLK